MKLIRVDAKVTEIVYKDTFPGYTPGNVVARGDFVLVSPDKLIGVSLKNERTVNELTMELMPYQWFVYLLLVEYSEKYCIGECASREHAIQIINELPESLGCEQQE